MGCVERFRAETRHGKLSPEDETSDALERDALSGLLFDRDIPRKLEHQRALGDTAGLNWWPPERKLEHSDLCAECQEIDFKQAFHPPREDSWRTLRLKDRLYKRDTTKYRQTIRDSTGAEWLVNDSNCQLCLYLFTARCRTPGKPEVGEYYVLFHNESETDDSKSFRKDLGFDRSSLFQVKLSVLYPPLHHFPDTWATWATVICHIGKPIRIKNAPRILSPRFQESLAKSWLEACNQHHPACVEESLLPIPNMKLIHCRTRRVTSISPEVAERPHFAALSYVWGSNPKPTDNPKDRRLPDILPLTISDALMVTQTLDLQYLWVDQYCIDQSDPEHKHQQIQHMDLIYKSADITIIAAAGDSRDYGLPGVSSPRRDVPHPFTLNFNEWYLTLGVTRRWDNHWKSGKWHTRGWTFQEALLSRRRLVFSDTMMHFECENGSRCSEHVVGPAECLRRHTANESSPPPAFDIDSRSLLYPDWDDIQTVQNSIHGKASLESILAPFLTYIKLATKYTERELSDPADGLNAFRGAAKALQRSDNPVYNIAGIPFILPAHQNGSEQDWADFTFSYGLSWHSWTFDITPAGITPARKFPTWSWGNVQAWSVTWEDEGLDEMKFDGKETDMLYFSRDIGVEAAADGLKKVYTLPQFAAAFLDIGSSRASTSEAVPTALCFKTRNLHPRFITKMPSPSQCSEPCGELVFGNGGSDIGNIGWDMELLIHGEDNPADGSEAKSDGVHEGDHSSWPFELRVDNHKLYRDLKRRKCDLVLLRVDSTQASVLVVEWLGSPEHRPRTGRRSGIVRFEGWWCSDQALKFLNCFSVETDLRLI